MRVGQSELLTSVGPFAVTGIRRNFSPVRPVMAKITALFFILGAAVLSSTVGAGEDPLNRQPVAGPSYSHEVVVSVANLDVFVRDREGRPVEGLSAEDFRVIQDGVEMEVSNFAALSPARHEAGTRAKQIGATGNTGTTPPSQTQPVYVVLHIDNENLRPINRNRVMTQVRSFVEETLQLPVQIMVVSSRRTLKIMQPFTNDPDTVIGAMQRVANESGARIVRDRERRRILNRMEEFDRNGGMVGPGFLDGVSPRITKVQVQAQILSYCEEESGIVRDTLANMREVVRLVSCMTGRRSIVYVSGGLPMTPGLGLMHEFAAVFRDSSIYARVAQRDYSQQFRSLANAANREGVRLYTIDASGLNPLDGFGGEDRYVPDAGASSVGMRNLQTPLTFLADETGGVAVLNTNDVTAGLQLIRDDIFSYYSLGYRISSNDEDTVHHIEVELPRHPDYDIRCRKWFVAKSLETKVRERVLQTLVRDLGHNPMDLRLTLGDPAPAGGKRWEIPLRLSFPVNSLILEAEAGDLVGQIELFFCVRDARGQGSPTQRREYEVRIPAAQFAPDRAQRYGISVQMLFKAQQNTVAVGLVDRVNRQTSYARTQVQFP